MFTTPLIRAVKESNPGSLIGYWCNTRVKDIFENDPKINRLFALSRGDLKKIWQSSKINAVSSFLKLLRGIKKEHFDVSIDFSLDHRYGLITKLLGIKKRIGFNYKNRGRFLTDKINIDGYQGKHVVEYYLSLLNLLEIKPKSNNLEIYISENHKAKAKNILSRYGLKESKQIIGIAPGAGASWGKDAQFKHWPAVKYAQLADKIIENYKIPLIILGDSSEQAISDIITTTMKHKAVDLTGKTNLNELCAIINGLSLLITNDGGPLHIACATQTKSISIFGPVDNLVYGPYPNQGKHIVIKNPLKCSPCYQNFKMLPCENNKECINDISTEEVYEAVKKLL